MSDANEKPIFILVDDDEVNNSISRLIIDNAVPGVEVAIFTDPFAALRFLTVDLVYDIERPAILFLNLRMPLMSGWEFLDNLASADREVLNKFDIYILTSSIDPADRIRSEKTGIVKGYLGKPLTAEIVLKVLSHRG